MEGATAERAKPSQTANLTLHPSHIRLFTRLNSLAVKGTSTCEVQLVVALVSQRHIVLITLRAKAKHTMRCRIV